MMSLPGQLALQITTADIIDYVIYAIVVIIAIALVASTIKIVREYERLVVFRLGRLIGAGGPGVVFVIPVVNRFVKIDLRERYLEVPHQTCITKERPHGY